MEFRFFPTLFFLILLAILYRGLFQHPHTLPSALIGKKLPYFQLDTPDDQTINSEQLPEQFVLLNIWASWCGACAAEQPFLMKLSQEGIAIYGLSYKDSAPQAKQWLSNWGNPYRALAMDSDGRIGMELGVYGTPETFLINPKGIIIYRHPGVLTQEIWQNEFVPLMKGN